MTNYNYEAEIRIIDRDTCAVRAVFSDFLRVATEWKLNDFGLMLFAVNNNHRVTSLIETGDIIKWRWRNSKFGIDWCDEWIGLYFDSDCTVTDYTTKSPIKEFLGTAEEPNSLLAKTRVSWFADVDTRSTFSNLPAETIMKLIVDYNLGSNATAANGRLLDNTGWNVSVATDQARGNNIERYSCAHKKLLDVLRDLSVIGGIDFELSINDDCSLEFEVFPGQYGTNRASGAGKVVFSTTNKNLVNPKYVHKVRDTFNAALVLGQGDAAARDYAVVLHPTDYDPSLHREMIVDARNESNTGELTTIGLIKLLDASEQDIVDYTIVQLPTMHYCQRYDKGDIVGVNICNNLLSQKITNVVTTFTPQGMSFDIGTNNRATGTRDEVLLERMSDLNRRVDSLETGNNEGL